MKKNNIGRMAVLIAIIVFVHAIYISCDDIFANVQSTISENSENEKNEISKSISPEIIYEQNPTNANELTTYIFDQKDNDEEAVDSNSNPIIDDIAIISENEIEDLAVGTDAIIASGNCGAEGDNLTWKITGVSDNYTLTIDGSGDMENYTSLSPWNNDIYNVQVKTLVLSKNLTSIGTRSFRDMKGIKTVEIPDGVMSIGDSAFYNCESIDGELEIPGSVKTIGKNAFNKCINIRKVVMKDGVKDIGEDAFTSCENMVSVIIPDSVETIQQAAFYMCRSLMSVHIPGKVKIVDNVAFMYCSNLSRVSLGEGVETLWYNAFAGCPKLTYIYLPKSFKEAMSESLSHCSRLSHIYYAGTSQEFYDKVKWSDMHYQLSTYGITFKAKEVLMNVNNNIVFYNWNINNLVNNSAHMNLDEAMGALSLSYAAYISANEVDETLRKLELIDDANSESRWQYAYNNNGVAHTISLRNYNGKNVITITIRGSFNGEDWGRVNLFPNGFKETSNHIIDDLKTFLKDRNVSIDDTNNVYLITGHSMGGAVAGNIAKVLNSNNGVHDSKIHCYTFAAPYNVFDLFDYSINGNPWYYIFNIINNTDVAVYYYQPGVFMKARWGRDKALSIYSNLYAKYWYHYLKGKEYPTDTKTNQALANHETETYMGLILDAYRMETDELAGINARVATFVSEQNDEINTNGFNIEEATGNINSNNCLINLRVEGSYGEIGRIENGCVTLDNSNLLLSVFDNEIYAVFFGGSSGRFKIEGLDSGKIQYEISDFNPTVSGDMVNINTKTFDNVTVEKGKLMASDLSSKVENASIELNVVDENGNITEIVNTDGSEIKYILPKSISLNMSELTLKVGESYDGLRYTVSPENSIFRGVLWSSNNTNIVSINSAGVISANKVGKTKIYVEIKNTNIYDCCTVYVKEEGEDPIKPDDPENPGYDDEEGIQDSDLPAGKKAPENIWIGGLQKKYAYTGSAIKPDFRVYYGEKRLAPKLDYTVSYKKNINPGTDARIVLDFKGNFTGIRKATFEIEKNPLSPGTVSADALIAAYRKGKKNNKVKPVLAAADGTVLKYTTKDFDIEYKNAKTGQSSTCEDPGEYVIYMTVKSGSKGYASGASIDVPLTVIEGKPVMSGVKVSGSLNVKFTGEKILPTLTLKYAGQSLSKAHYSVGTVSGDNYTDPGSHVLILKGDGVNVFGAKRITYKITGKRKLDDSKYTVVTIDPVSLDEKGQVPYAYGGAKPEVIVSYNKVRLKKGRDYTVSYKKNGKAGNTATLTVKGIGGYTGTVPKEFKVSQRDLKDMILVVNDRAESAKAKDYEKTPIKFYTKDGFTDQRLKKTDYTVTFTAASGSDKPAAGETISVNIAAKSGGNFTGETTATFRIIKKTEDIGKAAVAVNKGKAFGYTGKEIKPDGDKVVVKLKGNAVASDKYELIYYNNVNRGSAAIWVKGKSGYGGGRVVRFKIGGSKASSMWNGVVQAVQSIAGQARIIFRPVWEDRKKAA